VAFALWVAAQALALPPATVWATGASAPALANQPVPTATGSNPAPELALATALVDALNRGDEDAAVALFDPEATLHMDRYAWTHAEIHRWARTQIAASIEIEPQGPFQAVPNRSFWTARVRRADWAQRGVEWVRLACQILTEGDHIMDFSADPLDASSVAGLGSLWRPGSVPDPAPPIVARRDPDRSAGAGQPGAPAAGILACGVAGLVLAGCALLGARRTAPVRHSSGLITHLSNRRGRRELEA
jgi:hypothetical protein